MTPKQSTKQNEKQRGRPRKKGGKRINSGRKKIVADKASKRTLYRRAKQLRDSNEYNLSTIKIATKTARKYDIAQNVTQNDEHLNNSVHHIRHTNESALAFYLEYDYSRNTYEALVKDTRSKMCSIYPNYKYLQRVMLEYQPQNYTIAESSIFVPLQNMLNKSIERLCNSIALNWKENDLYNLQMICTLGFDSSSGHTNPQQHFENSVNENSDPHLSLFVTSMILIKLESSVSDSCFWINPTPQSTRFCRPLRIALEKEESENTMNEHKRLSAEIDNLLQYKFKMCNGKTVRVKFVVSQTLFNGKCINTIVGNKASSRCPMCGRTAHEFGN